MCCLPGHAHCQWNLWEPLGTFWRSLLLFGNLWECFGGIYCSLGTFGNLLLFALGGPCNLYSAIVKTLRLPHKLILKENIFFWVDA